jgi:hypothetical protein
MSTFTALMLTGWSFQIASWFPKKLFITDNQKRRLLNLVLSAMALTIFLAAGMTLAYVRYYLNGID